MTKESKKSPGLSVRTSDTGPWSTVQMGERFSKGLYIFGSRQQMFTLSVSLLCIDVLMQDAAKTPFQLRRRVDGGDEAVAPAEHPVAEVLNEPSEYYGPKEFLRRLVGHLAIDSEHFVAVRRDTSGRGGGAPVEMQGITKRGTEVRVEPDARRYSYFFSPSTLHERAQFGWASGGMSDRDVAHLRKRSLNGVDALATSQLMQSTLGLLEDMQQFQSGIFANGGMPIMAFAFPEGLTDEQFKRLNEDLRKAADKARREGKPFILEGAGGEVPKVEKVSLSSVDTEFVKAHAAAGLEATRYFRVPPHKVWLTETIKYDNLAAEERRYVDEALCPYFEVIEEGLGRVLLSKEDRRQYFLRFDREKAYTSDPEVRHKVIEGRWKNGMIEYDEMRQAIGMNAKGGKVGKRRMFSGNFVLVDENDEVILKAGGNNPNDAGSDASGNSEPSNGAGGKARLKIVK